MADEFLDLTDSDISNTPNREPVRIIVIGSRQAVLAIIHAKTFATADEWSSLQPEPMTGKLMSVVTKYVRVE